uniref:Cysteine sulfinic acid decarboxylase n=1 Tax=Oncorhynchus tshawytscha TaxID=74940 RepID=A0A8C8JNR1_ONCTS
MGGECIFQSSQPVNRYLQCHELVLYKYRNHAKNLLVIVIIDFRIRLPRLYSTLSALTSLDYVTTTGPSQPYGQQHLNEPLLDHREGQLFLTEAFKVILEEVLCKGTDVNEKVCEWREPEELATLLDLELREYGEQQHQLLQRVRDVAKYSVKTNHPRFFNQLFAGVDYHALTGRFLTEALNTSQYTYEVAPVFVLMEDEVLSKLRSLVGWAQGDGIFCPGGTMSNMYAMNLARYRAFPEVKLKGQWALPRLAVFTSQEVGENNFNSCSLLSYRGCMITDDLSEKIELAKSQGAVPFLVHATSGTTVQGAFDPLEPIADICDRQGLWMHVDAAWGGSVLFSKEHRHLMRGVERWESGACSGIQLLECNFDLLKRCHSADATYLFQQDKFYDMSLDTGDKSIQCGRKVDCLKLWLMWKAVGSQGLEERVDRAFAHTRYLVEKMMKREGFQLIGKPEFVNVCFWFIPPSLRGKENSPDYQDRLSKVAPVIKERMIKQGTMMVGYQPLGGRVNFFRMIVISPQLSYQDMTFFLDEIERLGNNL